ncbi:MAG: hypothetical protein AUJ28_04140 [Parcubacteria group bacterium CG1_02_37_51]|uniref:Uncharacterized protein n=2 Tax=Candidatus Komeiliibacteriota TaxID=1817908 RepID=A0A2M8DQK4_9BACT|nr:MAG: hypothetical protein AUJ28_04140 [Parcubacteria group bacterium CG1_02_37_51]PIY94538.1 MAG: hypothetical protein COY67_02400 [Candidatus Komeilibacteria bacterium CG_4_10_14_0_8_um_filter_37_78]PJC01467.1 MAG: hypothetical protein CO073_03480 [Candidatus Komeilibacteria bacterium CG_4_9_14_0_8_um_filter_36_9]
MNEYLVETLKVFGAIILIILLVYLINYDNSSVIGSRADIQANYGVTVAGVTVHGCNSYGWIQNNNGTAIIIREEWGLFNNKATYLHNLESGERIRHNIINGHYYLILYISGTVIDTINTCL